MRKKNVIICHSEAEMDRKAESLSAQGYKVRREESVHPVPGFCFTTYKVVFWNAA